jgi:hypothetical protein
MAKIDSGSTVDTLSVLMGREGGDLHFRNKAGLTAFSNWVSAANVPKDYKPFSISIYDTVLHEDVVSLVMMINPRDLNISQNQVVNSANTRFGWINTLWGNQQATISASGLSAGFYFVFGDQSGGISNFYRRNSVAFLNLLSVVALFKNNANYYMDGKQNPTYFNDGTSRVINVMDIIRISYDGSEYLGNFLSFTLTDAAANPYRMEYNFEFSVSMFGSDPNTIDGHIKRGGNEKSDKIIIGRQGKNTDFSKSVLMDVDELNTYFILEPIPDVVAHSYSEKEEQNEQSFYGKRTAPGYWDTLEGRESLAKVPDNSIRVTRGWKDGESHDGKVDYRTASGMVRSFTEGTIVSVGGPSPGGPNFVVVESKDQSGQTIYTRYYHLDPDSMGDLSRGKTVPVGAVLGKEGTDGGKYPPHVDLAVSTSLNGKNIDFNNMIDASPMMNEGFRKLNELAKAELVTTEYSDYLNVDYKHGKKTNASE